MRRTDPMRGTQAQTKWVDRRRTDDGRRHGEAPTVPPVELTLRKHELLPLFETIRTPGGGRVQSVSE